MAFPADTDRVGTNSTTSSTTHNLTLPGSLAAGDLLLAIVRCPGSTTISWPTGWIEHEQNNADASDDETSMALHQCDGTEGGSIVITLGTSRVLVGLVLRITASPVGVYIPAAATGSATQPDSPDSTPPGGADDILWISMGGCDDAETLTSGPSSYSNATVQASTATGASGCTVFCASRQLNAASENPGAWTLGSTSNWVAWNVAVKTSVFSGTRMSQEPVEVAVLPTNSSVRVSQEPVEVAILPSDSSVRVSQEPVEVAVSPTDQRLRLTSIPVEVLVRIEEADLRLTSMPVEVLIRHTNESIHVEWHDA